MSLTDPSTPTSLGVKFGITLMLVAVGWVILSGVADATSWSGMVADARAYCDQRADDYTLINVTTDGPAQMRTPACQLENGTVLYPFDWQRPDYQPPWWVQYRWPLLALGLFVLGVLASFGRTVIEAWTDDGGDAAG